MGKGIQTEMKLVNDGFVGFWGKGVTVLEALKMDNVGWDGICR